MKKCSLCHQLVGETARTWETGPPERNGDHLDSLSCNTERMVGAMDRLTGVLMNQGLPNDQGPLETSSTWMSSLWAEMFWKYYSNDARDVPLRSHWTDEEWLLIRILLKRHGVEL